jgi:TP901 family phage tail tape measure protein
MGAIGAAGMLAPVIATVIGEIGQFKAEMGEVKGEMSGLEAANTRLAAVAKVATLAMAAGAATVAVEGVKMAMGFDQQMEMIHTQAGASQAEVEMLKQKVLDLAPAVGVGPDELAAGLYHIESTGMRGAQALDTLTQAAKLSKIGMASLDDVTYAMSGVMAIGMKDIHNASDAISFMNATVGMGDMRMGQLTAAIGTGILPAMKNAGLGMTDFSAAIATLADNSTPADEAATRLRMTISLMASPHTTRAIDALKAIGLTQYALADDMRKPNGLMVAVKDLQAHLASLTANQKETALSDIFGGAKTDSTIQTLLLESGKLQSKYDQLGTAQSRAATTQEAWSQQQQQFSQQWSQLIAQVDVFGIKVGNKLIPIIQEVIKWMSQHTGTVKDLAKGLGVLAAAFVVLAAAEWVASLTPITLIIAAIILGIVMLAIQIYFLVKMWNEHWGTIKQISGDVWHWIYHYVWQDGILKAFDMTVDALHKLEQGWNDTWTNIGNFFKTIYDHTLKPVFDAIGSAMSDLKSFDSSLGHSGANLLSKLPHFAQGGTVPGPAGSPQLIVAHGGETVLTRDQAAAMTSGVSASSSAGGGWAGGGGGGPMVAQITLNLDSRKIWQGQLQLARGKGISPLDLLPEFTGSLQRS